MAEQPIFKLGSWPHRFRWTAAAALAIALATGCHRAQTPGDTESSTGTKGSEGTSVAASTGSNAGEKVGPDKAVEPALPPPKFVRRKQVTAQFPDKTPQATWNVKIYSDGSEVYDGLHTEFYFNGKKLMEGQYVDGKQEGKWKYWGEKGNEIKTETYRNGKLDGAWTLFRDDGSKERDVGYKNGKRDGKWVLYDTARKNQPLEQHEYKADDSKTGDNADGTWIKWYPDGKKQSEEHFTNGQLDGVQSRWYATGKPQEVQSFKNGLPEGKRIRWKENGDKIDETDFQNGHPVTANSTSEK